MESELKKYLRKVLKNLNKLGGLKSGNMDFSIGKYNINIDIENKPPMIVCSYCGKTTIKNEPPCRWCEDGKLLLPGVDQL